MESKAKKQYKLSVTLADKILRSNGDTVLECLQKLEQPIKIFTKGDIEVTYGKKNLVLAWTPAKVRNLYRKLYQPVLAKYFEYLLK